MDQEKLLTYAIPCYNSAGYMDHCIQTLIDGAEGKLDKVEIIIVDDGSTKDDTAERADAWQERYPGVVVAIHQENAGHGGAVNKGLANAHGMYFKVVDSDDWVDVESARVMIELLETLSQREEPVDLVLANYVYENVERGQQVIDYHGLLPVGEVFGWSDIATFPMSRYILMHSVIYRTEVLRSCGLKLPEHTFYVDNIFVYVPLPYVKTIFYVDLDFYRYFIGRDDQSVNEKVMIGRIDQQLRITRIMIDSCDLMRDVSNAKLRDYMMSYLLIMMAISSLFSLMSDRPDKYEMREKIWEYLKERNPGVYPLMKRKFLGWGSTLPGKPGALFAVTVYHLAQRLFKFN